MSNSNQSRFTNSLCQLAVFTSRSAQLDEAEGVTPLDRVYISDLHISGQIGIDGQDQELTHLCAHASAGGRKVKKIIWKVMNMGLIHGEKTGGFMGI